MPFNGQLSRRDFLVRATSTAAGLAAGAALAPRAFAGSDPEESLPVVVQVRSNRVVTQRGIHDDLLIDLVDIALRRVTAESSISDAWRSVLDPNQVVALKFDPIGAEELGTNGAFLRALVESLSQAGFDRRRILAIGVSPADCDAAAVRAPAYGWSNDVYEFESGRDHVASWLEQVDAVLNVPTLKTHNIVGLSGALLNLSHSVVKHPGQYYGHDGTPYVGDIVAMPAVQRKLKLNIVNALRVVFDGGPEASEDSIWDAGMIFASQDPVAADAVGLQVLDEFRMRVRLPELVNSATGSLPYLEAAADRGVGACRLHQIAVRRFKL